MRVRPAGWSLISVVAALCPLALHAQHAGTTVTNPYLSAEDRAAGAKIFRSQCAGCHGRDGAGGAGGTDLTTGLFRHGASDEDLFRAISKGISGTTMPASNLNGREVWQVAGHVRSLSLGKAAEKAKGNPAKGAEVFQSSGCARCHAVGGNGGQIGPDLTDMGLRRSLGQLQRSVLRPDEEVASAFWTLRGRTRSGISITGIRLNEDTYSFQIRTDAGRLQSILKQDLADYEIVRSSPMPAFENKLSGTQFEDLIAYLASLRGGSTAEKKP
jgi:cytochrome c oxidase cbb3-type subunit 3